VGDALWERAAAQLSHFLLYVLMIALPVTGWVISSASNVPFKIFWTLPLPAITAPDKAVADLFAVIHGWLVTLLPWCWRARRGALRHHYVKKDTVSPACFPGARHEKNPPVRPVCRVRCGASRASRRLEDGPLREPARVRRHLREERAPGVFRSSTRASLRPDKPAGGKLDVTVK